MFVFIFLTIIIALFSLVSAKSLPGIVNIPTSSSSENMTYNDVQLIAPSCLTNNDDSSQVDFHTCIMYDFNLDTQVENDQHKFVKRNMFDDNLKLFAINLDPPTKCITENVCVMPLPRINYHTVKIHGMDDSSPTYFKYADVNYYCCNLKVTNLRGYLMIERKRSYS